MCPRFFVHDRGVDADPPTSSGYLSSTISTAKPTNGCRRRWFPRCWHRAECGCVAIWCWLSALRGGPPVVLGRADPDLTSSCRLGRRPVRASATTSAITLELIEQLGADRGVPWPTSARPVEEFLALRCVVIGSSRSRSVISRKPSGGGTSWGASPSPGDSADAIPPQHSAFLLANGTSTAR